MRHVKSVSVVRPASAAAGFCGVSLKDGIQWCMTCEERRDIPIIGPIWAALSPICSPIWDQPFMQWAGK